VLGLPDRGRLAPGLRADVVLLDARDWRHLAYHLAGEVVHTVVRAGQVVVSRA
jgi:imidazolonepropionase